MKKALLISLTFLICHFVFADICFTTFEKDSANADVIFVGKLIDSEHRVFWVNGSPAGIYTFEVIESFKGLSKYTTITSIVSPIHGCCSPHFKMDSTFLVFAFSFGEDSKAYWTNDCTLTELLSESEEYYKRLGESIRPTGKVRDLERFEKIQDWRFEDDRLKTDSINLLHSTLQSSLSKERKKNTYLIAGIILLALLISVLVITKARTKSM
ncbi:MAG: hypothetical protein RLN90_14550 [Balneolaceae bacterium]